MSKHHFTPEMKTRSFEKTNRGAESSQRHGSTAYFPIKIVNLILFYIIVTIDTLPTNLPM